MSQAGVEEAMALDPVKRQQVERLRLLDCTKSEMTKIRQEALSRVGGVMKGLRSLPKNCDECAIAFNTCQPLCQTCVGRMTSVMIMMGHIIGQTAEKGAAAHKGRKERLKRSSIML